MAIPRGSFHYFLLFTFLSGYKTAKKREDGCNLTCKREKLNNPLKFDALLKDMHEILFTQLV